MVTQQIDNDSQVSALDMIHCCGAILEYPKNIRSEILKENVLKGEELSDAEQVKYERVANREENFWVVYHDILNE